jgi:hypothetical protein
MADPIDPAEVLTPIPRKVRPQTAFHAWQN